jgi:hypothetical protein
MVGVGGLRRESDRDQRRDRGRNIDDAFDRVRQQCDAAGEMPGEIFQREDDESDQMLPAARI